MEDEEHIKKALKDGGLYEDSLTKEEMRNYYMALSNSQVDSGENDRHKNDEKEVEDIIGDTLSQISSSKKKKEKPKWITKRGPKEQVDDKKKTKGLLKKGSKDQIDDKLKKTSNNLQNILYQDLKDLPQSILDIIYPEPHYKTAILQEDIKLKEKPIKLSDYHNMLNTAKALQSRKSLHFASEPRPILSSVNCSKTLRRSENEINGDEKDDLEATKPQTLYTSRSGRQVLKRSYFEDSETDSENSLPAFPSKRLKNISDSLKISSLEDFIKEDENQSVQTKLKKATKADIKSPLSNEHHNKSRSEILLEKASIMQQEKEKEEIQKDHFNSSLDKYQGDDASEIAVQQISDDEFQGKDEFQRKRVPPPIPKPKRTYIRKKNKSLDKNEDQVFIDLDKSPKSTKGQKKNNKNKSVGQTNNKCSCPICGNLFSQFDIERHAANCTNFADEDKLSSIQVCEICGKSFDVDSYIDHSKICTQK